MPTSESIPGKLSAPATSTRSGFNTVYNMICSCKFVLRLCYAGIVAPIEARLFYRWTGQSFPQSSEFYDYI